MGLHSCRISTWQRVKRDLGYRYVICMTNRFYHIFLSCACLMKTEVGLVWNLVCCHCRERKEFVLFCFSGGRNWSRSLRYKSAKFCFSSIMQNLGRYWHGLSFMRALWCVAYGTVFRAGPKESLDGARHILLGNFVEWLRVNLVRQE